MYAVLKTFLVLGPLALPPMNGPASQGIEPVSDPGIGESTSSHNLDLNDPSGSFSQDDIDQQRALENQQVQANDLQQQDALQKQQTSRDQLNQLQYNQDLQPQSNPQKQLFQPPQFGNQPQTPGAQY